MKRALCATVLTLLLSLTAAANVNYTYDAAGHVTKIDYGNGSVITYTYDNAGNLITRSVATTTTATTIQTVPPGLHFAVDAGAAQTAPQTLNLAQGTHTIAVNTTQAATTGTQYVFTRWNDGGAVSHSITVGTSPATYTATFQTQYQLTTAASPSAGGTVTPASGTYQNAGSVVSVQATANTGYQFANFSGGTLTGGTNPQSVTLNGPANVVANFTPLAPHLAATMGGIACSSTSSCSANVTLTNTGLGPATNTTVTNITDTSGVTVATGVPRDFGTINPGASLTFPVTFNWPSTAARPAFTIGFTADGGYSGTSTVSAIR